MEFSPHPRRNGRQSVVCAARKACDRPAPATYGCRRQSSCWQSTRPCLFQRSKRCTACHRSRPLKSCTCSPGMLSKAQNPTTCARNISNDERGHVRAHRVVKDGHTGARVASASADEASRARCMRSQRCFVLQVRRTPRVTPQGGHIEGSYRRKQPPIRCQRCPACPSQQGTACRSRCQRSCTS